MKFDPNAVDEGNSNFGPWPIGEYDFEVQAAEDTVSKAGNDMIKAQLAVFNAEGRRRVVFEYLLSNQVWKLKAFAAAAGMMAEFEAGEMDAAAMVGRVGRVKLGIEPAQNGYDAKNKVLAYIAARDAPALRRPAPVRQKVPAGGGDLDDSIPFGACWQ